MTRNIYTPRARKLRQDANTPEQQAWQILRQLRKQGFPVRRQHPIAGYVVDFAITKARLVIELDGSIHDRSDVKARDAERDKELRTAGWDVLRVQVSKMHEDGYLLHSVMERIGL